jgi:hypothetical protein
MINNIRILVVSLSLLLTSSVLAVDINFVIEEEKCQLQEHSIDQVITIATESGMTEVDVSIIYTAMEVGIITKAEALQLIKDIKSGKVDIVDVNSPDGIITFGTITYDEE